jgi:Pro-kumamolisin, activation domain/Bacterial Ig-like domain (group 3)/Subtilase family
MTRSTCWFRACARATRVFLVVSGLVALQAVGAGVASAKSHVLHSDVPSLVSSGRAALHGHHNGRQTLDVNVGLRVRDSAGLDALIAAASTPGSPQYGHYLTNAEYLAKYAPTAADVQAATSWLKGQHLDVSGASPDNLLVHVHAKTSDIEHAFGVTINDYKTGNRVFHANDRPPSIPDNLNINWVSGLSDADVYHANTTKGGFDGSDFRSGYDITGDGAGQTIGFTLWGPQLPQSDFDGYATATSTTKIVDGGAGNDGINWVQVDGATTDTGTTAANDRGEIALDVEVAHAVAPKSHLTYYLGKDSSNTTLEHVLNQAANSGINVFSNSWGCDGCSADANEETSLQHGVATGKTFFFATGDNGAAGKSSAGPQYPALSQYVVAVGGTNLTNDGSGNWQSENAWSGSGGGCLNSETRPTWQTGLGTAPVVFNSTTACTGRVTPDVATNGGTNAYTYVDGADSPTAGTSEAAPIWGAMALIWNNNNAGKGRPGIGFAGPLIYSLANDSTAYARDFHDITSGNNGFAAGTGWDEVTGWGSPDFNKLTNNPINISYTGPTHASKGDTITLSGTLGEQGGSGLSGRKISFAAAGENCDATTDSNGNASCSVTVNDSPGHYSAIAAWAGDAAFNAGSDTQPFTVDHIATTVAYTGPSSGDYNDSVTLSGKLTENSDSAGVSGETLSFSLGAESCSASTDTNGNASCAVTPLDTPGPYTASVTFAGDAPTYESSSTTAPFTLNQEESKVSYTGPVTVHYHDAVTPSATLTDPDGGAPIAGKDVKFTLGSGGDTCTATTDASGNASCSLTPHVTGTQDITASFAGDKFYVSSSDKKSFSITPEETTMTYTGPTVILAGASGATLTATLVEDGSNDGDGDGGSAAPSPAESVTLSIGAQSCTATTDSSGNVSCTIPSVTVPLGSATVGASFAGDAYYQAASASKTAIVFAFPSRGAFVLGDKTVNTAGTSGTVTWWSDQWSAANSLTAGGAPPAFQGFAGSVSSLPTKSPAEKCGTTFTTSGGNSPPPTAGVPAYMGVLVANKAVKDGSAVNGNFAKIVVVKVNPGYAPDPSHLGTGKVVATFCG